MPIGTVGLHLDRALFVGPLDRVLLLRSLPMLEGLSPTHLAAVAQHTQERFFAAGTTLQSADDSSEAVYLIVEGEVAVRRQGRPARRARPGAAVGFIETLSRSEQPLEVLAMTDTVTLEFDADAQIDVCEEHFPVVMQYVGFLARSIASELQQRALASFEPIPLIAAHEYGDRINFVERVLVLSRSRVFSTGCLDALCELAQHVVETSWDDGDRIWSIDEPAESFYLIVSGSVTCRSPSEKVFTSHPGRAIGIYETLYRGDRWNDARSQGRSVALRIDVEPFIDILEDHSDLALDFMALLATDLITLQDAAVTAGAFNGPSTPPTL